MDSATDLQLPLRPMHFLSMRSTLLVASFALALPLCLTASGVRPMVTTSLRSVAICSAQRSSARLIAHSARPPPAKANLSKPRLQMQRLQSLLVKQVAFTNHSWNPDTGAMCHMTPHRQWLTHYRARRVPVRLGDNSGSLV